MPLKDIRTFIHMAMEGDSTIDPRLELICRQKQAVEDQIQSLQETLETLNFKCWYYETAKAAGTTDIPRNMTLEDLPQEYRAVRKRLRGY